MEWLDRLARLERKRHRLATRRRLSAYRSRQKLAGMRRLDVVLSAQHYALLRSRMLPGESLSAALAREIDGVTGYP